MNSAPHECRAIVTHCAVALMIIALPGCFYEAQDALGKAVVELIKLIPSECEIQTIPQSVAPTDTVLGMGPAREITLRLKEICVTPIDDSGLVTTLPAGDYKASYVDSNGAFYDTPDGLTIAGRENRWTEGGIYVPFEAGRYSDISMWNNKCPTGMPAFLPIKKPLPAQCSLPYGKLMVFVREGLEIAPSDINQLAPNAVTPPP